MPTRRELKEASLAVVAASRPTSCSSTAATTPTRTTASRPTLAWQLFRRATILEYEIPKWDGDLGPANLYVPLDAETADAKVDHLLARVPVAGGHATGSRPTRFERSFDCVASSAGRRVGLAEAFVARKLVV